MTTSLGLDQPAIYEIQVQGLLPAGWQDWFDGFTITNDGQVTRFCGLVADQSALFGLLIKIRDLGLTVLSVQRIK